MAGEPIKLVQGMRGSGIRNSSRGAPTCFTAVLHDDDTIAERHGFDLIMRHEHRGRRHALAQLLDLQAHLRTQLRIEVRQWLIEQEHLRVAYDAAAESDALLLSA